MIKTTLPLHKSGLVAIGHRKDGRPIYPIQGGSTDGGADGDGGDNDGATEAPSGGGGGGSSDKSGGGKEFVPIQSQAELDRIIGQRLTRQKAEYSKFDEYKSAAEELAKIRDGEKTDAQKAVERAEAAEKKAAQLEHRELQRTVAEAKGIPLKLAARLQGTTREELEADADEFLGDYTPPSGGGNKLPGKPREKLRGGGAPDEEPVETDPAKLAASIPRT